MRKFISKMKKTKSFDKVEPSKKEFSRLYKKVVAYKSTIKKDLLFQMISRAICEHDTNDFNKMVLVP